LKIDRSINTLLDIAQLTTSFLTYASKKLCISFSRYIHTPTAQACPLKNTYLIVLEVLVLLLPPLFFCSLNFASYQTQRKIKNIARKAPSHRVLLSLSFFCLSPKSPPLKTVAPQLSNLYLF
jgi:hypothetical protein